MKQDTKLGSNTREGIRSNYLVGESAYMFADPAQEIEWLALLELQRQLDATTCVREELDAERMLKSAALCGAQDAPAGELAKDLMESPKA